MSAGRLVLAVALRLEARAVARVLGRDRDDRLLVRTGVGTPAARRHAAQVLQAPGLAGVVVVGICGALDPTLAPGAVVVSDEIRDESAGVWPTDPALRERLAGGAPGGVAVTVARPAWSAAAKSALHARTGASICEMEAAAWAAEAHTRGVPIAMVRAVADVADDDLPDLGRLGDPSASWTSLARLLSPRLWGCLPGLARRARHAALAAAEHLQRGLA